MVFLSEAGGQKNRKRLQKHGWGRLWARGNASKWKEYPDEPFCIDCGMWSAYVRNQVDPLSEWCEERFKKHFKTSFRVGIPEFVVVPDLPAKGIESLEFSLHWLKRMQTEMKKYDCPKYLAIQDGMTIPDVEPHLKKFEGIFLGGTLKFKAGAKEWCEFTQSNGKKFHFARCGTPERARTAFQIGVDSIDSSTPLQNGDAYYNAFELAATGNYPQMQLFTGL